MIYDEFDIWRISSTAKAPERLTSGRGDKIYYRKYYDLYTGYYPLGISKKDQGYNLSQDLILATHDSLFNYGFAKRRANGKIIPFVKSIGNRSGLRKAMFTDAYIYMKEKFNEPPSLHKLIGSKSELIAASNMQQAAFKIGKTELISFKNQEGDNLHGLLHYPDNYEKGKQYPMIVSIYEIISPQFQKYQNPRSCNDDGFNIRNYTAKGYFVLEPDILIKKGNPGVSATDCTVKAVNTVMEKGIVDKNAIGLIGHSFGGYETAFVITQTDLFAAAVVGAGVFDMVTFAHIVNPRTGVTGFSDIEDSQWKMEKSSYQDKERYRRNSPIEHAHKIKTPTMIWTGNRDLRIDWHQSVEMYLGLRRLGADVELLIYENEIHVLTKKKNQMDLTKRVENWFSKYLKINKE
jgi:dipeptidyl aminopeptidase/acylaminoacyl peptidase